MKNIKNAVGMEMRCNIVMDYFKYSMKVGYEILNKKPTYESSNPDWRGFDISKINLDLKKDTRYIFLDHARHEDHNKPFVGHMVKIKKSNGYIKEIRKIISGLNKTFIVNQNKVSSSEVRIISPNGEIQTAFRELNITSNYFRGDRPTRTKDTYMRIINHICEKKFDMSDEHQKHKIYCYISRMLSDENKFFSIDRNVTIDFRDMLVSSNYGKGEGNTQEILAQKFIYRSNMVRCMIGYIFSSANINKYKVELVFMNDVSNKVMERGVDDVRHFVMAGVPILRNGVYTIPVYYTVPDEVMDKMRSTINRMILGVADYYYEPFVSRKNYESLTLSQKTGKVHIVGMDNAKTVCRILLPIERSTIQSFEKHSNIWVLDCIIENILLMPNVQETCDGMTKAIIDLSNYKYSTVDDLMSVILGSVRNVFEFNVLPNGMKDIFLNNKYKTIKTPMRKDITRRVVEWLRSKR